MIRISKQSSDSGDTPQAERNTRSKAGIASAVPVVVPFDFGLDMSRTATRRGLLNHP